MSLIAEAKKCLDCSRTVKGRSDKKFCNDHCRNNYNNRIKSKGHHHSSVRNINTVLLKNRKILELFLPETEETSMVSKGKLEGLGFKFRYGTHIYTTKTGETYYYCYDYGYLALENDWFLIVKQKKE